MSFGYTGKILRANLSTQSFSTENPPDNFYRCYFGGEGFVGFFLLKEVSPKIDPLGPENKLIFAAGPLTGVPSGGCGRHSVGAKSPLTGGFGEAESGGYWGAELKMAGFDAVIVEGRASKPTYLLIKDGDVQFKDASHLWGRKTLECQNAIREELGDSLIRVAQIGPAGENLVRFACVVNDLDAFAGRTGMGAVMGSKNLKAIACRGHKHLSLADPAAVKAIARWTRDNAPIVNKTFHDYGTASFVMNLNRQGALPTYNFREGTFEEAKNISGQAIAESIFAGRRSCFACPIQCKREVKVTEPYNVDPHYGGPEYETIAAFGSNCGIGDLKVVAKANELANAYGLDTMSCGVAIAFAIDCFKHGLLTKKLISGLDLRFGKGQAVLELIEQIALRRGLGDLLAEGVARASKKLGLEAEKLAFHIKGQEVPLHEPRWKQGMAVGYAISPTRADQSHSVHDSNYTGPGPGLDEARSLGILEPLAVNDLSPAKIRLLTYHSNFIHFMNSAVCCYFVMIYGGVGLERITRLVEAATGWNTSSFELLKIGERSVNMARIFNIREGFTVKDDTMPAHFFTPQKSGPLQGVALDLKAFEEAKQTYYGMMGWPNGIPSAAKLGELGIEWALPAR